MSRMRNLAAAVLATLSVLVLTACNAVLLPFSTADAGKTVLPPDIHRDLPRNPESLDFQTFVAVEVELSTQIISTNGTRIQSNTSDTPIVIATIRDGDGSVVFRKKADQNGAISGKFHIPTVEGAVFLTLEGRGFEPRSVRIDDPAALTRLDREMAMAETGPDSLFRTPFSVPDSDGDGVPDDLDDLPWDDAASFAVTVPAEGLLTVAFEDNYPGVGDGDYNDFLSTLALVEFTNADGSLAAVGGMATARAKIAGYNHEFGLVLDLVAEPEETLSGAPPMLVVGTLDETAAPLDVDIVDLPAPSSGAPGSRVSFRPRIRLFESTREAVGPGPAYDGTTAFFLLILNGEDGYQPAAADPYDPYLYIHNTGYDVHLAGKPPLEGSGNPSLPPDFPDEFVDRDGFPRALLVPTTWSPPKELRDIREAYPDFIDWMIDLKAGNFGSGYPWYHNPVETLTIDLPIPPMVDFMEFILDRLAELPAPD